MRALNESGLSVVGLGSGGSPPSFSPAGCAQTRFKPSRILSSGHGSPASPAFPHAPHPTPTSLKGSREHPFRPPLGNGPSCSPRRIAAGSVPPRSAHGYEAGAIGDYLQIGSACSLSNTAETRRADTQLSARVAQELARAGREALLEPPLAPGDQMPHVQDPVKMVSSSAMGFSAAPLSTTPCGAELCQVGANLDSEASALQLAAVCEVRSGEAQPVYQTVTE